MTKRMQAFAGKLQTLKCVLGKLVSTGSGSERVKPIAMPRFGGPYPVATAPGTDSGAEFTPFPLIRHYQILQEQS
jgi:hypothetical protein